MLLFGLKIRFLREQRGFNQKQLAEASHITQAMISRIESWQVNQLKSDSLRRLAEALEVPVDYLVGRKTSLTFDDDIRYDETARDIISGYKKLGASRRKQMRDFLEFLLNEEGKGKRNELLITYLPAAGQSAVKRLLNGLDKHLEYKAKQALGLTHIEMGLDPPNYVKHIMELIQSLSGFLMVKDWTQEDPITRCEIFTGIVSLAQEYGSAELRMQVEEFTRKARKREKKDYDGRLREFALRLIKDLNSLLEPLVESKTIKQLFVSIRKDALQSGNKELIKHIGACCTNFMEDDLFALD